MTLAAFEDSGWYKVNYSIADSYRWGKGQGCRFGLKKYCSSDENSFFCTGKKHGCHYTHKDRGVCHTDSFLSPCRVYKSDKENACVNGFHEHHADRVHLEVYGDQSKCFMSNITSLKAENASELVGRCFEHRCLDIRTLQVKVDHEWYSCPDVGYLEVSVYRGVMLCPDAEILCHDFTNQTATTQLLPTTEQTTVITDYPLHVMTRFDRDIDDINTRSFIIGYRDAVSQITGIRSSRIVNGHITGDSLRFFLLPADNVSDTLMSRDAVVKLEQAVKEQRLRVELGLDTFTAIYIGDADLASEHATVAPLSGAAIACIVVIIVALLVIVNGILLVKLRVINLQKLRDRLLRKPPPTTHVNGNAFKMNGV
ncbi:PREDICTED: uncharacterized protein LOC106809304 [Priapulus caudatus]|uniref:Leishmanolysin-like peptidase n=1 Tax=Priapulus caudatus TaxID=37621 RepID=A0ABM1E6L0_PRICU|nr:PREDICTED: uncharacterized protein LOC106809304 [Priapulus caudatus]